MASPSVDNPVEDKQRDKGERTSRHTKSTSRFRFKEKRKASRHDDFDTSSRESYANASRERFEDHYRISKSKRRKKSFSADLDSAKDGTHVPEKDPYDNAHLRDESSNNYLDPERAFRESLFDAMADDEGAQYWEAVYGQPIHTYSRKKENPTGELEEMNDEEYAAYVRAKMYEKTHQHLLEEKARRDAARKEREKERERRAKEGRKHEREADNFRTRVEESLKRGEERKKKKMWSEKWEGYLAKWDTLGTDSSKKIAIASIPWPVESGRRKDVDAKEIKRFFLYAPTGGDPTEMQLSKTLKVERVRWHPDKIQQKLGGQDVNEEVLQAVTAVFQIIDRLWSDLRDGKN